MARKVYYRGEGDENTFHDTTAEQLRANERAATDDFSEASEQTAGDYSDNLDNRRDAENDPRQVNANARGKKDDSGEGGFYRGKGGASEEDGGNSKVKGKKKSKFKKFGPVMLILMGIFGVGGLSFMGSLLGPFALVSNALDQFNVMRTSMNTRSTYFTRFQMDDALNTSLTKGKRFGIFGHESFKISNRMRNKLLAQGIEYEVDTETKARYLHYTNPTTGEESVIYANDKDGDALSGSSTRRSGKVISLDDMLEQDDNFFTAHQNATKTVKGHIVGWFESLTNSFMNRIHNSRNKFDGDDDETSDDDVKNKAKKEGVESDVGESEGESGEQHYYKVDPDTGAETEVDEDTYNSLPESQRKTKSVFSDDSALVDGMDETEVESALKKRFDKISGTLGKITTIGCGVMNAINALNIAVTAIQVAKVLNFTTGLLEAIQRTQIGDGGSEMMTYFNAFSQPRDTVIWNGKDTNVSKDTIRSNSTMSSVAYNETFGGANVDPNDPEAKKFNRDSMTQLAIKDAIGENGLSSLFGMLVTASSRNLVYQSCIYANMVTNIFGIIGDIITIVATGGIGKFLVTWVEGLINAAKKAAVWAIFAVVVSWAIPKVAQWLATDLIGNMGGEDSAYAMRSGFNMFMGKSMEANSGAVGNKAAVLAMYDQNQEILAQDARYDRLTLSPLDPTSKYTFVGSIVQSLMPMANMVAGSAPLSALGSAMRTVGQSALATLPSASAASKKWYDQEAKLNDDCPNLSQYNIVGDAYCNPYYTTDFSTIQVNPYEVVEQVGLDNFEDEEVDNPAIKMDSELGTYIVACTLRDTQYGVKDAAIQTWIQNPTGNSTANTLIDTFSGIIPVLGNLYDLAQSEAERKNLKWNTGQACVQDSSVNPDWEKNKWYQRYVEDQTLMEAADIIEESQVTAFVEKYYEENPIDNSLEGVIARYGGVTKEQAEGIIALAEYVNFVANYDSSERYPLPVDKTSDAEIALKSINSAIASTRLQMPSSESFLPASADELADTVSLEPTASLAAAERVIYFDLRSRVYTV